MYCVEDIVIYLSYACLSVFRSSHNRLEKFDLIEIMWQKCCAHAVYLWDSAEFDKKKSFVHVSYIM